MNLSLRESVDLNSERRSHPVCLVAVRTPQRVALVNLVLDVDALLLEGTAIGGQPGKLLVKADLEVELGGPRTRTHPKRLNDPISLTQQGGLFRQPVTVVVEVETVGHSVTHLNTTTNHPQHGVGGGLRGHPHARPTELGHRRRDERPTGHRGQQLGAEAQPQKGKLGLERTFDESALQLHPRMLRLVVNSGVGTERDEPRVAREVVDCGRVLEVVLGIPGDQPKASFG